MDEKELANCTFAKTILMFSVVLYHSVLFWGGGWFVNEPVFEATPLLYLAHWLNSFHIYGFTLISGYLFFYLKFEKGAYPVFGSFIKTKVRRLLIPYAFTATVWVIPIAVYFFHYDALDVFQKYALGISPSQLWFLLMLFDVFLIFWPLSNFMAKHTVTSAFVVIGLFGLSLVGGKLLPNVFGIWTACAYSPVFWIGFKMRQRGTDSFRRIPVPLWLLLDLAVFTLCEFMPVKEGLIFKMFSVGSSFVLHMLGAIMAFVVLQKVADQFDWNNRFFNYFSKRSMAVYLFHQQIIYFFIYRLNGLVNPYLNAGINFIGSMVVSLIIATALMKFKVTRFLIGEK